MLNNINLADVKKIVELLAVMHIHIHAKCKLINDKMKKIITILFLNWWYWFNWHVIIMNTMLIQKNILNYILRILPKGSFSVLTSYVILSWTIYFPYHIVGILFDYCANATYCKFSILIKIIITKKKKGGLVNIALLYSWLQVGHFLFDGIKF